MESKRVYCAGMTVKGKPCGIYWGLKDGFCSHHITCQGVTRYGLKCSRRGKYVQKNGYCDLHQPGGSRQPSDVAGNLDATFSKLAIHEIRTLKKQIVENHVALSEQQTSLARTQTELKDQLEKLRTDGEAALRGLAQGQANLYEGQVALYELLAGDSTSDGHAEEPIWAQTFPYPQYE